MSGFSRTVNLKRAYARGGGDSGRTGLEIVNAMTGVTTPTTATVVLSVWTGGIKPRLPIIERRAASLELEPLVRTHSRVP
ncbi:MAG: hypothetical protein A3H95_13620 [Acidobacteria bacterium RIFCSPLOWO2_02_FULL_64_15]|nr:MAG: hypothetical protein A3H95_13620 [Acidobacteria bacterium RIFCSPLOWO2_02_FULL_64_15]